MSNAHTFIEDFNPFTDDVADFLGHLRDETCLLAQADHPVDEAGTAAGGEQDERTLHFVILAA